MKNVPDDGWDNPAPIKKMEEMNYSKRITPDDWGAPQHPTKAEMYIGLLIPVFFFLCGIFFEHFILSRLW